MAKNEISDYDEVDANNTDISGLPVTNATLIAQVDDIVRAEMGALKRWFKSSLFRLRDGTDVTKLLALDLQSITAATTRTLAVQDKNGTIALTSDINSYATTATAGGTTVLTVASAIQQFFTGTSAQTVTLPVASTLVLGQTFSVVNNSTGLITVNSSGGNLVAIVPPETRVTVTCILVSGTTAASWDYTSAENGNGSVTTTTLATTALVTGIATDTKEIIVDFYGLQPTANNTIFFQLGVAGSLVTTGYVGSGARNAAAAVSATTATNGLLISTGASTEVATGRIVASLVDIATNLWSITFTGAAQTGVTFHAAAAITLAGVPDRIAFVATSGNLVAGGKINTRQRK